MKKAYLNWSSGKDAAFALYQIQKEGKYRVEKLVSTVNTHTNRVSMHGLRTELLKIQAENTGIPLHLIELQGNVNMQVYNEIMEIETSRLLRQGFCYSIFGDIFLEDLKEYREKQLQETGLEAVFPLWKKNTHELITEFIEAGFKAIVVCVNAQKLDKSFCGRIIDEAFVKDLPNDVDPCGENGEFHSFVFEGPVFKEPIEFSRGEVVERGYSSAGEDKKNQENCYKDKKGGWDTRFWYCDLVPK